MFLIRHVLKTDKERLHPAIYPLSLMVFAWVVFEGVISYLAPLVIVKAGYSESMMGAILGFSAFAGLIFDFLLCRVLKNTNFRRIFLLMILVSLLMPLFLLKAETFLIYLIFAVFWGLAYDLFTIGNFNFVDRFVIKKDYAKAFGFINIFHSLGYVLAPLIIGIVIEEMIGFDSFLVAWGFVILTFLFYLILLFSTKKDLNTEVVVSEKPRNLFKEFVLWEKIGKKILPILILTAVLNIIGAFYWTVGPLIANEFHSGTLGGFLIFSYELPPLLIGLFVGSIANKFGKKKTSIFSLLFGSLLLIPFFWLQFEPTFLLIFSLIAAFFFGLAYPTVNGIYNDFINEAPGIEKEIETIEDSFTNIAYIVGPIFAGLVSGIFGHFNAFGILGLASAICAVILLFTVPKEIKISENQL